MKQLIQSYRTGELNLTVVPAPAPRAGHLIVQTRASLVSMALGAVRVARVSLGETVAVIGLGLLGQLAVQLLRAAGCHVLGMDINAQKNALAQQHGADAAAGDAAEFTALCLVHTHGL